MKGKYCCFNCAKKDYNEHEITDMCQTPGCNYSYNFPIINVPKKIEGNNVIYNILESKGRGFYAVTYLCETGNLKRKIILKVIPKLFYENLKSNGIDSDKIFEDECVVHSSIAEYADNHIVNIDDYFQADVDFSGSVIRCYIMVLKFIQGKDFSDYIKIQNNINARNFAQLTIDMFKIWGIFRDNQKYHNDLHGKNLLVEEIKSSVRRIGELNSTIRLVAIDMNSISDENLSGDKREGDQTYIYNHLYEMANLLRKNLKDVNVSDDIDYRLLKTLEKTAALIRPGTDANRHPSIDELIQKIKDDFNNNLSYAPWEREFVLNSLDDGYNAQTIHNSYIPFLLVDPNDQWVNDISIAGPQIITGMRGCGKTTLMGALDFHSRAAWTKEQNVDPIIQLKKDTYIAISVTCSNLIDNKGEKATNNNAKLIWLYALEFINIIRHMKSIREDLLIGEYINQLILLLQSITTVDLSDNPKTLSDLELERYLSIKMEAFTKGGTGQLKINPKNAFENLAKFIMSLSPVWNNKKVFFLLDDASTRYLHIDTITELFTDLLFQSNICSFKITTELQSVELMQLSSPGKQALAREGRDFTMYDFGAKVLEKINADKKNEFIIKICEKRKKFYTNHPNKKPEEILGNISLDKIAMNIIDANNAQRRKEIYYGLSALVGFCVGDIGDVILLYDRIVRKYNNIIPVNKKDQSECFQVLCSGRLYNLNRKGRDYSDNLLRYATSFAEASHFLLKKSKTDYNLKMNEYKNNGFEGEKPTLRLRQYTSLHVRVTSDETKQKEQLKKLMDLVDAGVFVFQGGSGAPRSKNIGANPILQFKLIFRKLYGIASLIGLSDRDRFELSGNQLDEWLNNPTKEILIQNLIGDTETDLDIIEQNEDISEIDQIVVNPTLQIDLFADSSEPKKTEENYVNYPKCISLNPIEIIKTKQQIDVLITALGFEERTFESTKSILTKINVKKIYLIKYSEDGKTNEIINWLVSYGFEDKIELVEYLKTEQIIKNMDYYSNCLIDITGLSKLLIFKLIKNIFNMKKELFIAYTEAKEYYPMENIIKERFENNKNLPRYKQFINIMEDLMVGENTDKYIITPLISETDSFNARQTALLGFVVSKNQRMLEMLEKKEYVVTELFVSSRDSFRSKLAQMAADVIKSNYTNVNIIPINHNDPEKIMDELFNRYNQLYAEKKLNIELALTGTKWQTLACAALNAVEKISQCWYVEPSKFDINNFSIGAKETIYYSLKKIEITY